MRLRVIILGFVLGVMTLALPVSSQVIVLSGPPKAPPPVVSGGGACQVGDISGCEHYTIAELFATNDGGFCPPDGADSNGLYMDSGPQHGIALRPGGGMYMAGMYHQVAEISIPAPVYASSVATMNYASYIQAGVNPTLNGASDLSDEADEGTGEFAVPEALLVYNGKLYGTLASNYWGVVTNGSAHYVRSLTLASTSGLLGLDSFGNNGITRYISKFLKEVPLEWRAALGGPVFSGAGQSYSILSTQSRGPSGCVIDPEEIDGTATYHACDLLVGYYDGHYTLGDSETAGPHYLESMQIRDGVLLDGTDNILFFGTKGDHDSAYFCYGPGTSDIELHNTPTGIGDHVYCYDPVYSSASGFHAWPYKTWVWNYRISDLAKVKAGTLNPWDVVPTESGTMDPYFPIVISDLGEHRIQGVAWDRTTRHLYVTQQGAGCTAGGGGNAVPWRFTIPGTTP